MKHLTRRCCLAALLPSLFGAGLACADTRLPTVTDPHFQLAKGYLTPESLPLRLALLGGPPKPDSAA
ncbi:hypothetical protein M2406_005317, partial [Serratia sp. BIGb0163]|nr:hypothetical protein [Serratia sp. BIGb0163]